VAAQVLVKLGADLNRVRQQVIQLLHGHEVSGEEKGGLRRLSRLRALVLRQQDVPSTLAQISGRLSVIERRLGIPESPTHSPLDEQFAALRTEKEEAIDDQDFEKAAALRDRERELLAERAAWQRQSAEQSVVPILQEATRLSAEVARLRALLEGLDLVAAERMGSIPATASSHRRRPGNGRAHRRVANNRRCDVSPGPHLLPSRITVRLEPRCAFSPRGDRAPAPGTPSTRQPAGPVGPEAPARGRCHITAWYAIYNVYFFVHNQHSGAGCGGYPD
jgi:hypothetical protein